jgi:hypothetical protein
MPQQNGWEKPTRRPNKPLASADSSKTAGLLATGRLPDYALRDVG